MRRKRVKRDAFEQYHRNAMKQEIFGMLFAVVSTVIVVGGLAVFIQHFPKG